MTEAKKALDTLFDLGLLQRKKNGRVVAADTDMCPVDLGAYSSRVTFMVGNAAIDACRKLRRKIVAAVAEKWEVDERRVRLIGGQAIDLEDPERAIPTPYTKPSSSRSRYTHPGACVVVSTCSGISRVAAE